MDETASLMPSSRLLVSAPSGDLVVRLRHDLAGLRSLQPLEQIDALLQDQHRRWQCGQRLAVEVYRLACPEFFDTEALLHLIASEALLRRGLGETIDPTEYLRRFPQHAEAIERQLQVEEALETAVTGENTFGNDSKVTVDLPRGFAPPVSTREIGVPGFEILAELGRGGMGVVYKARQVGLNRLVALKMILAGAGANEIARQRFRLEAEAVAQLKHPHIVPIYSIGEHANQPFFALEFIAGGSLASKLDGKPWLPRRAAELVATLANAVYHAHERGIIHRDLKPANILLDEAGSPHITDFGLARSMQSGELTLTGAVMGTPAYMAPEQAGGLREAIGPATDVFGLGAILYQLLTGKPPYQGPDLHTTLRQAERGKVEPVRQVNPQVPAALARICDRALARDLRMRYSSAAVLEKDLRRYLAWGRRLTIAAGIGTALTLLLGGTGALFLSLPGLQRAGRQVDSQADPESRDAVVNPAPLDGTMTLRVYSPTKEGPKLNLPVQDPGALPVRFHDLVHAEIKLNQKAYCYLVWVDGQGSVDPLYPWSEKDRDDPKTLFRPAPKPEPAAELHSPAALDRGWPVEGPDGLETVMLMARKTPLPADVILGKILDRIPPSPLRELHEVAVRGYNKEEAIAPIDLFRKAGKETQLIDDPLLQMMQRVRSHFEVVRAVRFAYQK